MPPEEEPVTPVMMPVVTMADISGPSPRCRPSNASLMIVKAGKAAMTQP